MYLEEPLETDVSALPEGLAGTEETVLVMCRLAVQGSMIPATRQAAESAIRPVPQRDMAGESRAVERWVRDHLRYTRDGLEVETLKTPALMLAEIARFGKAAGDCDDASILTASLLLSLGHAPAFQVLGRDSVPHHVNVIDRTTGLELDPTGEPRGRWAYRRAFNVSPLR